MSNAVIHEIAVFAGAPAMLGYTGVANVNSEVWIRTESGQYRASGLSGNQGGVQRLILALDDRKIHTLKLITDHPSGSLESNEVTTMVLWAASENEQNRISWNAYPEAGGFSRYELYRNGALLVSFSRIDQTEYVDTAVTCGERYDYQIKALTSLVTSVSAGQMVSGRSEKVPSEVSSLYCTVQDDRTVYLSGEMPAYGYTDQYRLIIERSAGREDFEVISIKNTLPPAPRRETFTDEAVAASEASYCYRMIYENACGNRSAPSATVCSVWLYQHANVLRWSGEAPFVTEITHYELWMDVSPLLTQDASRLEYRPDQPGLKGLTPFRILAYGRDGHLVSESNTVMFRPEPKLQVPSAFSPNGDGHNAVFKAYGVFFTGFRMTVLDKWGKAVFYTDNPEHGWDGTIGGQDAAPGYYVYTIEVSDVSGKPFSKRGSLLLIR